MTKEREKIGQVGMHIVLLASGRVELSQQDDNTLVVKLRKMELSTDHSILYFNTEEDAKRFTGNSQLQQDMVTLGGRTLASRALTHLDGQVRRAGGEAIEEGEVPGSDGNVGQA